MNSLDIVRHTLRDRLIDLERPQAPDAQSDEITCQELMRQAGDMLVRERMLSALEARGCLYELAQARKLFLSEAATAVLAGREVRAGHCMT